MVDLQKIAVSSEAAGFEYYDVQDFNFSTPGQFLPFVSGGSYASYNNSLALPKNRLNKALTPQILTSVLLNTDDTMSADKYVHLYGKFMEYRQVGTSGGFPIIYDRSIQVTSDPNNVIITLDVGNSSGVNSVTPPTIKLSGKVFFYLAPF